MNALGFASFPARIAGRRHRLDQANIHGNVLGDSLPSFHRKGFTGRTHRGVVRSLAVIPLNRNLVLPAGKSNVSGEPSRPVSISIEPNVAPDTGILSKYSLDQIKRSVAVSRTRKLTEAPRFSSVISVCVGEPDREASTMGAVSCQDAGLCSIVRRCEGLQTRQRGP
jgi:hypothetical protein